MSNSRDLPRREVLRRSILLAAACVAGDAARAIPALAGTGRWTESALQTLPHVESARAIGRLYLASASDPVQLLSAVFERLDERSTRPGEPIPKRAVLASIESDYASSRVQDVDGWALSETEIAFCVLLASNP